MPARLDVDHITGRGDGIGPVSQTLCSCYPFVVMNLPGALRSAATALLVFAGAGGAQQREPAIEVFGLAGGYAHGNLLLAPQSNSLSPQWRPQLGGGVLAPLARNWGALFDATTSVVEANWKWDGLPGAGPEDNFARVRRVILVPSVVRLWRRDRFSIYAGAGVGFEHDRERTLFRPIVARDEKGQPVLGPQSTENRVNKTLASPALRVGVIVSLSRRLVLRSGYSYVRHYTDERGSRGLEAGIGYRF
jgi:opacity protein-like surface antigen